MHDLDQIYLNELAEKMFATRDAASKATIEFYRNVIEMHADQSNIFYAWFKAGFDANQARNMFIALREYLGTPPKTHALDRIKAAAYFARQSKQN